MTEPTIIHESHDWIALNKPAGWHTSAPSARQLEEIAASGGVIEPHIEGWLRERFDWADAIDEAGLVHRLDAETTGCLVAARTDAAHTRLRDAFTRGRSVGKTYLAETQPGIAAHGSFRLYFSSRYKRSRKVTVEEQGEVRYQGRCAWTVIAHDAYVARLEVELIGPGRRHQIRAGLAYVGFPILGDGLYGGAPTPDGTMRLHAWKLALEGEQVECAPAWSSDAKPQA